jgi:hypothetical protein
MKSIKITFTDRQYANVRLVAWLLKVFTDSATPTEDDIAEAIKTIVLTEIHPLMKQANDYNEQNKGIKK